MVREKIKSLEEVQQIAANLKNEGKKIVHCHGCFDVLHYGHIKHFEAAKSLGDVLIATVTPDRFVNKGPGRPFFNEDIRMQAVAALESIDYVALNKWETAVDTIRLLKPDYYVKGKEVIDNAKVDAIEVENSKVSNLKAEEDAVLSVGGKIHLTDEITFSSTRLINQITDSIPNDAKVYLSNFKKEVNSDDIINTISSLRDIKVLVIGDAILDEYKYCKHMEKSAKEALVAYKSMNSEIQAGGVFAIANHLSTFTNHVQVLTCMGKSSHYELLKSKLHTDIDPKILVQSESESLIKTRFVDDYKRTKLLELYSVDELVLSERTESDIIRYLQLNLDKFDMVLIADFGHGLITPKIRDFLQASNKFLAVNCQLNGSNFGFNYITKYSRADFVSLNARELRLAFQEKKSDISVPLNKLSKLLNVDKVNVTLGAGGSVYQHKGQNYLVPVFNAEPVDTVGAGDAVLSLLSLLAYKDVNPKIMPFIGNCMGALAVRIPNNSRPVSQIELNKFIKYILK